MRFYRTIFFALAVFLVMPSSSLAFSDVPQTHRFANEIQYVQDSGIVQGYSDGSFRPEATINRAEFTKIIISSLYPKEEIENCNTLQYSFSDVSNNNWFAPYVCVAKKNGIVNGYADGKFKAGNTITLPEAMKILTNSFHIGVPSFSGGPSDDGYNGHWGIDYMYYFRSLILQESNINKRILLTSDSDTITMDMFSYKISRGEMAYFIKKIATSKAMTPLNMYQYNNANNIVTFLMPRNDKEGVSISSTEEYNSNNQELLIQFYHPLHNEGGSLSTISANTLWDHTYDQKYSLYVKKVDTYKDLQNFLTPLFESKYTEGSGNDYFGKDLPGENAIEYAQFCAEGIQMIDLKDSTGRFYAGIEYKKVFKNQEDWKFVNIENYSPQCTLRHNNASINLFYNEQKGVMVKVYNSMSNMADIEIFPGFSNEMGSKVESVGILDLEIK